MWYNFTSVGRTVFNPRSQSFTSPRENDVSSRVQQTYCVSLRNYIFFVLPTTNLKMVTFFEKKDRSVFTWIRCLLERCRVSKKRTFFQKKNKYVFSLNKCLVSGVIQMCFSKTCNNLYISTFFENPTSLYRTTETCICAKQKKEKMSHTEQVHF